MCSIMPYQSATLHHNTSIIHPETRNTHHTIFHPGARNIKQCPQPQNCHHQQTKASPPANFELRGILFNKGEEDQG